MVNAPKPNTRRKPVDIPAANDVRDNMQSVDPNGSFKFTLRVPMETAIEFKMEAARRMMSSDSGAMRASTREVRCASGAMIGAPGVFLYVRHYTVLNVR